MELLFLFIGGIILIAIFSSKKEQKPSRGPIVGTGRSPEIMDQIEGSYAEFKARLEEDAANGVMYKRSKPQSLLDIKNKVPAVYEEVPAQTILDEFNKYADNGYH